MYEDNLMYCTCATVHESKGVTVVMDDLISQHRQVKAKKHQNRTPITALLNKSITSIINYRLLNKIWTKCEYVH